MSITNDGNISKNLAIHQKNSEVISTFSPWSTTDFSKGQLLKLYQIQACLPAAMSTSWIKKIKEIVETKYNQIKIIRPSNH